MIWPNGPAKRLKNLSAFTGGEDEPFVHFTISKNNLFGVFVTAHQVGIYRLKPFVPAFVYTNLAANFTHVSISPSGRHIAVLSGSKIHIFKTAPMDSFNEILKSKSNFNRGIGPGEALGVRELTLVEIGVLESKHEIINLCPFQEYFVVVSPEHMQFSAWSSLELQPVHTGSILNNRKILQASHSPLLSRVCLLCDSDQLFLVHLKRDQFKATPLPTEPEPPLAACFNLRFAKVVVVYESRIILSNVKDMDESPVTVPLQSVGKINTLEWSPMGNVLLIGHSSGWCCISVLGMPLYSSDTPIKHSEWSVGGDEIMLLTETNELICYETSRAFFSSPTNFQTPILCFGNRIQVEIDKSKTALPSNSWATVPVPKSYLGISWPITTAAATSDGRFVALAGSYGLIYMSTSERQWKIFAERDVMIRTGGILWFNDYLVLSVLTESNKCRIEIYSSAIKGSGVTDEEEQLLSGLTFEQNIVTMSVNEKSKTLAVLLHNGIFQVYDIGELSLTLVVEDNLLEVFSAPGRVRTMAMISSEKYLFLIDDRLVQVTKQGTGYVRRTVHTPVEYFFFKNGDIWVFDGHGMVIVDVLSFKKFGIDLDAYPFGININKGIISTTEAFDLMSYDRSYTYAESSVNYEVYLPHLFEVTDDSMEVAKTYKHLNYFDDVMESTLYHTLVDNASNLPNIMEIIKEYCNWSTLAARCARKSETKYWDRLFEALGEPPETLFDQALKSNDLETASEYLMILQAQFKANPGDNNMLDLYKKAIEEDNFDICKQLSDFLAAVDGQGKILEKFVKDLNINSPSSA